jgi:hypothetical protein
MRCNSGASFSSAVPCSSSVGPLRLPMRGLAIACWMSMPQSSTFTRVRATQLMIECPPGVPMIKRRFAFVEHQARHHRAARVRAFGNAGLRAAHGTEDQGPEMCHAVITLPAGTIKYPSPAPNPVSGCETFCSSGPAIGAPAFRLHIFKPVTASTA